MNLLETSLIISEVPQRSGEIICHRFTAAEDFRIMTNEHSLFRISSASTPLGLFLWCHIVQDRPCEPQRSLPTRQVHFLKKKKKKSVCTVKATVNYLKDSYAEMERKSAGRIQAPHTLHYAVSQSLSVRGPFRKGACLSSQALLKQWNVAVEARFNSL